MSICVWIWSGAIARCVAFIRALQDVIQDYECPPLKNYAQELITFLNKYAFRFLVNCRPLSATMGATISYLKRAASQLSPQLSNEKVCLSFFPWVLGVYVCMCDCVRVDWL